METNKPLKRSPELQSLSRDHHHGLLLCWKIKTGFSKNIAPARIKKYADWFFTTHLMPHFELEEKQLFTILSTENKLIKKALSEHLSLKILFAQTDGLQQALQFIGQELEAHIRFEERVLFPEIQKVASQEQLAMINEIHIAQAYEENEEDIFWK